MIKRMIVFCVIIITCSSIKLVAQSDKQKQMENLLVGIWIEVPGDNENNPLFKTTFLAPDTIMFFQNKTMKSLENGIYQNGDWEIDKATGYLKVLVKYEGFPPVSYEYRFLTLTEEICSLEAADDEESEDHEIFRIRLRKLYEK